MKFPIIFLLSALSHIAWGQSASDYVSVPPEVSNNSAPRVMLAVSNDQELFKQAYDDVSDLDSDGDLDETYNNAIDYSGYFDSDSCYAYSVLLGYFRPLAAAANHQCGNASYPWSGNFLNWLSMTRMDVLREALYGGKRFVDLAVGSTILERAHLPPDGHAFAKVYSGSDINQYTPYSVTTSFCNVSLEPVTLLLPVLSGTLSSLTNPPQIRAAAGEWRQWAATSDTQCGTRSSLFGGDANTPLTSSTTFMTARVEACVDGVNSNAANCTAYVNAGVTTYKPEGLLQTYGAADTLRFGMISGSYAQNAEGGKLRRNILPFTNNLVAANDEISSTTGVFGGGPSVIQALSDFRIAQYDYLNNEYTDCASSGISKTNFKANTGGGDCRDWGNPLTEIVLEALHYFSNPASGPSAAYNTSVDSLYIPSLGDVPWLEYMDSDEACADCALVVINTGQNSFDADDLAPASSVTGLTESLINSFTETVSQTEGVAGTTLIGEVAPALSGFCDATNIPTNKLDELRGICSQLPDLEGSYLSSGLSLFGKLNDLRSDRSGEQSVTSYAVQLADSLPEFELPVVSGASTLPVTLTPFCSFTSGGVVRQCSLIDIYLVNDVPGVSGTLHVTWDDAAYGSDQDYDIRQQIDYCLTSACGFTTPGTGQIAVRTQATEATSVTGYELGYVISGVTDTGTKAFTVGTVVLGLNILNAPTITTHTATTSGADVLETPLWYLAKYGSFVDDNASNTPDFSSEFDTRDEVGNNVADGIPDNFFGLKNPANLRSRLGLIFQRIATNAQDDINSDTNNLVFADSAASNNIFYQAQYYPKFTDGDGDSVTWVGDVSALFIDRRGNLREDNNGNGVLDDPATDFVVQFSTDSDGEAVFKRYSDIEAITTDDVERPYESLQPIWRARDVLADMSTADVTTQRIYNTDAGGGRHILTAFDNNDDGIITAADTLREFHEDTFPSSGGGGDDDNYRMFGISDASDADDLVNYVRGEEIAGFRSRAVDYDSDSANEIWRLGDIVNSRPLVVGAPAEQYDFIIGDLTYTAFRQKYENRREMVYVGGNDGMIHAFNGGFYDRVTKTISGTTSKVTPTPTNHTLGAEMWAYVPFNLLPHLQWLSDPDYGHIYYMDGPPQAFDVNIFTPDNTHPNGWGTILVVGMRLGGGDYTVDTNGNGSLDTTTRSAFVVLDITDPEQPPTLLAEITDPGMGFTTSRPALVKRRQRTDGSFTSPSVNEWLLVFGSGPTQLEDATSDQAGSIYVFDLQTLTLSTGATGITSDTGSDLFFGDFTAVDWESDYRDDTVYFGTVSGTALSAGGGLSSITLSNTANLGLASVTPVELLDANKPVVAAPTTALDPVGQNRWALFGTGRFFVRSDLNSQDQQSYYGYREVKDVTDVSIEIKDVTGIRSRVNGEVKDDDPSEGGIVTDGIEIVETFDELKGRIRNKRGWIRNLEVTANAPSERQFTDTTLFGSVALFTTFEPGGEECSIEGDGRLFGLDAFVGVTPPFAPLGSFSATTSGQPDIVTDVVDLSGGVPGSPILQRSRDGGPQALIQGSEGEVTAVQLTDAPAATGRQSWREIFVDESRF